MNGASLVKDSTPDDREEQGGYDRAGRDKGQDWERRKMQSRAGQGRAGQGRFWVWSLGQRRDRESQFRSGQGRTEAKFESSR